jgi:hypothetical protein
MTYWSDSGGTSATTSYTTDTGCISSEPVESTKLKYHSEPLGKIISAGIIAGKISMFAHRGSPAFKDTDKLNHSGISPYYADPVIPGYDRPTKLFTYNFSIVIDALEYIQGKMAKANLIKEALATLKDGSWNPFVLVLAKTRKTIEELAKDNKYEEVKDGFLITDGPFNETVIQGLDVEDLLDIAHFARAKYAAEDTTIKTDLTCVRIYLNKQG